MDDERPGQLTPDQQHLAASIRACPPCQRDWPTLCIRHQILLDALIPERCTDPDCYACKGNPQ